jgi:hypothetical protein
MIEDHNNENLWLDGLEGTHISSLPEIKPQD